MKTSYLSLWAFCLYLIPANLLGQEKTSIEYLEKVFRSYQEMETLSMDIEAHAYMDASDRQGEKVMTGAMKFTEDRYYSKMDGIEMVVFGEKMIVVDHGEKTISLGRSKPVSELKKGQPVFSLESITGLGAKVDYQGPDKGNHVYRMEIPNSYIKEMELHINEGGLIVKMVHYYLSMPGLESEYYKMEVLFKNISQSPPPNSFFDEKKYIADRSAKRPSVAYRLYTVEEVDYSTNFYQN